MLWLLLHVYNEPVDKYGWKELLSLNNTCHASHCDAHHGGFSFFAAFLCGNVARAFPYDYTA